MTRLAQAPVAGLGQGSIYALIAMAFVTIYKSTLVISFAQPALMVVGASLVVFLAVSGGLNFYLAVGLAILLTAAVALVVERVAAPDDRRAGRRRGLRRRRRTLLAAALS